MGWLFSTAWRSKTDLQCHLTETEYSPDKTVTWTTERWTWTGTNLWTVLRVDRGETCDRCIVLYLTKNGGADYGWGYKGVGESMGPNEVNCPLSYLENLSPPQGEFSGPWREKVRAYHAEQKRKREWIKFLKNGDEVTIGTKTYRFLDHTTKSVLLHTIAYDGLLYRAAPRALTAPKEVSDAT